MQCDYCFYRDEKQYQEYNAGPLMKQETIEVITDKFLNMVEESLFFCFQGGEPLLAGMAFFRHVMEIQRKFNTKKINITNSIQTNGTLIDDNWCRFFKENNILVGVSLDGIRETHDLHRHFSDGRPSFEVISEKLKLLEKYGVSFNILTVVNRDTAKHVDEIYQYFRDCSYTFQQYIVCRDPLFAEKGGEGYSLSPEEYGRFLIELFDLWKQDFEAGNAPSIRQFENYISILLGNGAESCEQCGNCGITYAVEANGDVYPCDFYMLEEYRLGNIVENTVKQLDEKRLETAFVKKSTNFSDICKGCQFLGVCRNGCQRNRQTDAQGRFINYYCEGYRLFFSRKFSELQEIADRLRESL